MLEVEAMVGEGREEKPTPPPSMKTPYSSLVLVLIAAAVMAFVIPRVDSVEVAPPVPVTTMPVQEQYLVVDGSRIPVGGPQRAGGTLETVLNDFGSQGWQVRTTMSNFIILARQVR